MIIKFKEKTEIEVKGGFSETLGTKVESEIEVYEKDESLICECVGVSKDTILVKMLNGGMAYIEKESCLI
jgi:hypothetical protein